jgi:hypothetical protein
VNPIIRPLVEEIVRKRPSSIAAFINEYSFRLMSNSSLTQLTNIHKIFIQIPMKKLKKCKQSSSKNYKKKRRRKWKRKIVGKALVLRSLASLTKKATMSRK